MELKFFEFNGVEGVEVVSEACVIETAQDAFDIMANAHFQGASLVLMQEEHLPAAFFDLKTGLAGDILQKYSNYQMMLIIVGAFDKFKSQSLKALMIESNRGNQVAFVADRQTALNRI